MSGHQEMPAYDDNSVFSDLNELKGRKTRIQKLSRFCIHRRGAIIGHIIGQQ